MMAASSVPRGVLSSVSVRVRNVERLASRCEDILGGTVQFRGQDWKVVKVGEKTGAGAVESLNTPFPQYVQSLEEKVKELEQRFGDQ